MASNTLVANGGELMRVGRRRLMALVTSLLAFVGGADAESKPLGLITVDEAEFALEVAAEAPTPARFDSVALPHLWSGEILNEARSGIYRARFMLDEDPSLAYAVYLRELRMNVEVFVNGVRIGDGGSLVQPIGRNWSRPLYFRVPSGVLRRGENRLELRLVADWTSIPKLSRITIGPESQLEPLYRSTRFRRLGVQEISVVCLIVIASMIGLLVLRGVVPRSNLWIAAAALSIGFGQLDAIIRDIPVSTRVWVLFNAGSYLLDAACFVFGVHRLLGIRARRIEFILVTGCLVCGAVVATLPTSASPFLSSGVLLVSVIPMTYIVARVLRDGSGSLRIGVALSCGAVALIGANDVYAWTSGESVGVPSLTGIVPIVAVSVAAWFLLFQLRLLLTRTQRFNAKLDARLAMRETELEASHAQLQDVQRRETLERERERIAREMHDGVAGQLVSTVAWVESGDFERGEVADALREVLEEMRLSLDALGPDDDELFAALASIRSRLATRIERSGVTLHWRISRDQSVLNLNPMSVHNVVRIVQEAISNVLRHASARSITIRTTRQVRRARDGVLIEIADDGGGGGSGIAIDDLERAGHHGLSNMRRRALEISGEIELRSTQPGTVVALWIPLPSADA